MIFIDKNNLSVTIRLVNNTDDLSSALLYIRRVGDAFDSVVYNPSTVGSDFLVFTFDSLLLALAFGRLLGRLEIAGIVRTTIEMQYTNIITITAG